MSKFKEVAELYGLELGEKFNLEDEDGDIYEYGPLYFTEEGLYDKDEDYRTSLFYSIIAGEYVVKKLPWKPEVGERYWFVRSSVSIESYKNGQDIFDLMCIKTGNCFRSYDEADRNTIRIMTELKEE